MVGFHNQRYLHRTQGLVYWQCRTQHLDRHRYSVCACYSSVEASNIEHTTRFCHLHVSTLSIVSTLPPLVALSSPLTTIRSVLFASAYRFATIMQFDIADTTGTLAMACTWCVVGVASGIISACLPTLHPFMLIISSQFSNIRNQSDKGSATERQSSKTQLVTIGGTGSKRNQDFERLKDDYEVHCDFVATYTHGSRDDALLSRHKSPLAGQRPHL